MQQVLNPLVLGAKLYMDDLEEALNRLPTEYMEQCMMDLDEEDLRRKIQVQESLIISLEGQYATLKSSSVPMVVKQSNLHSILQLIRGHQQTKSMLAKQLEQLLAFNEYSPSIFNSLIEMEDDLTKGISLVSTTIHSGDGSLKIPQNLNWAKRMGMRYELKDSTLSLEDKEIIIMMNSEYGFNKREATIFLKLHKNLKQHYGKSNVDLHFLQSISSVYYNGFTWSYTNGAMKPSQVDELWRQHGRLNNDEMEILKRAIINQHNLAPLEKISSGDTDEVRIRKLNQAAIVLYDKEKYSDLDSTQQKRLFSLLAQYGHTIDFVHMNATMAAYLYQSPFEDIANVLLGGLDERSGYKGDVAGANGATPSMGNDDYRADLDAVNISIKVKQGLPILSAYKDYYRVLEKNPSKRVDNFVENIGGWTKLQSEYDFYEEFNVPKLEEKSRLMIQEGREMIERGKKNGNQELIKVGNAKVNEGKTIIEMGKKTFANFLVNLIKKNPDYKDYRGE